MKQIAFPLMHSALLLLFLACAAGTSAKTQYADHFIITSEADVSKPLIRRASHRKTRASEATLIDASGKLMRTGKLKTRKDTILKSLGQSLEDVDQSAGEGSADMEPRLQQTSNSSSPSSDSTAQSFQVTCTMAVEIADEKPGDPEVAVDGATNIRCLNGTNIYFLRYGAPSQDDEIRFKTGDRVALTIKEVENPETHPGPWNQVCPPMKLYEVDEPASSLLMTASNGRAERRSAAKHMSHLQAMYEVYISKEALNGHIKKELVMEDDVLTLKVQSTKGTKFKCDLAEESSTTFFHFYDENMRSKLPDDAMPYFKLQGEKRYLYDEKLGKFMMLDETDGKLITCDEPNLELTYEEWTDDTAILPKAEGVLMVRTKWRDGEESEVSDEEVKNGMFAISDIVKSASYGKLNISKSKVVSVNMDKDWKTVSDSCCAYWTWMEDIMSRLQRVRPDIDVKEYSFREIFLPGSHNHDCTWVGKANLGCGFPRDLPNEGGCWILYRGNVSTQTRVLELGHNLGLGHAAGTDPPGKLNKPMLEYGDASSVMGSREGLGNFPAADRYQIEFLREDDGEVLVWKADRTEPVTLSAISLPLNQAGAKYVAIKWECSLCVPKQAEKNMGGSLWIQYYGNEGPHKNQIAVHLARKSPSNRYGAGTELWQLLNASSWVWKAPDSPFAIKVCSIDGNLASVFLAPSKNKADAKCGPDTMTALRAWQKEARRKRSLPKEAKSGKGKGKGSPKEARSGKGRSGKELPKEGKSGKGSQKESPKEVRSGKGLSGKGLPKEGKSEKGSQKESPKEVRSGKGLSGKELPKESKSEKGSEKESPKEVRSGKGLSGKELQKEDKSERGSEVESRKEVRSGKGLSGKESPKEDKSEKESPKADRSGKGLSGKESPKEGQSEKGSEKESPKEVRSGKGLSGKELPKEDKSEKESPKEDRSGKGLSGGKSGRSGKSRRKKGKSRRKKGKALLQDSFMHFAHIPMI